MMNQNQKDVKKPAEQADQRQHDSVRRDQGFQAQPNQQDQRQQGQQNQQQQKDQKNVGNKPGQQQQAGSDKSRTQSPEKR